ncbi:MAG: hypothetical protein ACXWXO_18880, partial [Nocardioides sp.]
FPLPAIIACLILDGIDQTIFQSFGYDPPGYQGYDKAMDVYYLAIAYVATMRNWGSIPAYRIGQFLYFYRLVGVVAFELTQTRALLLIFPNTFEYFFIAYEAVRTRWSPLRFLFRWWLTAAALIWIFVKLPQEYWIHVAQLDVTDFLQENAWAPPLLVALVLVLLAVLWFVVRPRLPEPDWTWRFAADPLPEEMDTAAEQNRWHADKGAVMSWVTLEKVVLVGLLAVIFAQTLPGIQSTNAQLFIGTGVVVVVNAAFTLALARRGRWTFSSAAVAFLARTLANVAMVAAAWWLLDRDGSDIHVGNAVFFLTLISLITTLHDRYYPVLATRVAADEAGVESR